MNETFPFFDELILPLETEHKDTIFAQENSETKEFLLLTSEPQSTWSAENKQMLAKIVALCGVQIEQIEIIEVSTAIDLTQSIKNKSVKTTLCFIEQSILRELHFKPSYTGFSKLGATNIIFVPEISAFAQNAKAKKYLWEAIQTTFKQ